MSEANDIASFLSAGRDEILEAWIGVQQEQEEVRGSSLDLDELTDQATTLYDALVDAARAGAVSDSKAPEMERVRTLLYNIYTRRARLGIPAIVTAESVLSLNDRWLAPFLSNDPGQDTTAMAHAFSRTVNKLALLMYEEILERREETIRQQADEILEIATPVIRVWDGVVAAPIVGALDSERTHQLMDRLLNAIVQTRSPFALVDITGVPAIDTQTAQHLIDTVSAVSLLGSHLILTGVRPAIAQTLVQLGIDMTGVTTRSSFAAGLRVALQSLDRDAAPALAVG